MRSRIALICAIAIALAVFAFSMLPEKQKALTTGLRLYPIELGNGRVIFVNPHRIAHWLAFGVVTMAFCTVTKSARTRMWVAGGVLGFAWFIEWAEAFFYHSGFERYDVSDDARGILVGLILIQIAMLARNRWRVRT